MASLSTRSLGQIVQGWVAAAQASAGTIGRVLDFSVGSISLAIAEGGGAVALWLQKLALQALALTRLATSFGADADSWGAQFGFTRLAATQATGSVTFTVSDNTVPTTISVGDTVQTADGSQTFTVTADTKNALYNATLGAYVVPPGLNSGTVPVQAVNFGTGGNVAAGTITVALTGISNVASVTNQAALLNGLNAESDAAYKARFSLFLAGLARANKAAFQSAIAGVQQGLIYEIFENQNVLGSAFPFTDDDSFVDEPAQGYPDFIPWPGIVTVIVDDGSGSPSTTLLSRVWAALDAIRAMGVQVNVIGPVVVTANVSFTLTAAVGYDKSTLDSLAVTAVQNYLNALPLGTLLLPQTRIAQVIYDGVTGVANVSNLSINSQSADLTLTPAQVVKAGTIAAN